MMVNNKVATNWYVDQLNLYQAANSDPESLKKFFMVRTHEFELIIETIRTKKNTDPLQHELILGRRGSGKSTLLKRIQIEIDEDPSLSKQYFTINLAEEQAGIYRLSDLWYEVLKELRLKLNIQRSLKDYSDFEDAHAYTHYMYSEIHNELKSVGKRLILFLDNFDRILENIDEEANLLREILQNYNDLLIISGSTRLDEFFWSHDKPFYEFFRRHRLGALSFDEISALLDQWSDLMNAPVLKEYAKNNRGKIEALRILTDGLPRTLQFFIQILINDSDLYGYEYLEKVMDKATPLYQERLNNLTPPQRKIVLELAFIWEAASTKDLVERCRMESKLISSFLKQLQGFGLVEVIDTNTKNKLYRISERFFNMWLIVTQGNPEQKRKAKYLTIFLESWYEPNEFKDLVKHHLVKLTDHSMPIDKAFLLTKTLSQTRHISVEERDALIINMKAWSETYLFKEVLPKEYKYIQVEIYKLISEGKYIEAITIIDEIENEADGVKFNLKANVFTILEKVVEAEKYYLKAIDFGNTEAIYNLAFFYMEQGRNEDAEKYFLKAIDFGMIVACCNVATLYQSQGRNEEAEQYYLKAIDSGDSEDSEVMYHLSEFYFKNNIHKSKALDYITQFTTGNKSLTGIKALIIIEIWNNIFKDRVDKIKHILHQSNCDNLKDFILNLLYLDQGNLILHFFRHDIFGTKLQTRYNLLYYATIKLYGVENDIKNLRIPPEVKDTVDEILLKIKVKRASYNQSDRKSWSEVN